MTTKVHAVTDGLGNPLRFLLSSGNCNDICVAQALLEPFDLNGKLILADKGYDSDKFVRWLEERGGIAVIPSRIIAKHPRKTDWHTYKERHLVENLFLKLKTTTVLPLGMRRMPSIFTLLSVLPVSLFGSFDGFKTDSKAIIYPLKFLLYSLSQNHIFSSKSFSVPQADPILSPPKRCHFTFFCNRVFSGRSCKSISFLPYIHCKNPVSSLFHTVRQKQF